MLLCFKQKFNDLKLREKLVVSFFIVWSITYGILVITVNPAQLNKILGQEPFLTMIVDESNHIVAANKKEIVGHKLNELIELKQSFAFLTASSTVDNRSILSIPMRIHLNEDIPLISTFSRIFNQIVEKGFAEKLYMDLVKECQKGIIDGSNIAIDSSGFKAFEKKAKNRSGMGSTTWGAKFDSFENKITWFGYKIHLAVDTKIKMLVTFINMNGKFNLAGKEGLSHPVHHCCNILGVDGSVFLQLSYKQEGNWLANQG